MNFTTPKFDAAVAAFKADFGSHTQMFTDGQFYVTNKTVAGMIRQIEAELRSNLRLQFFPATELTKAIEFFRKKLNADPIDVGAILAMLNLLEVDGDMFPIRQLFTTGKTDAAAARADFQQLWSTPDIPPAPYWSGSADTIGKVFAAHELEKDRCFEVLRAMARKLLAKRGAVTLPPTAVISSGRLADAVVVPGVAATADEVATQRIQHNSPGALAAAYARMRATLDAGGFVHCGVLSGAAHERSKFPQPEHHVLVFAHDTIAGKDAFLFWDPDAAHTEITSTTWGRGFGVLFATATRLSTAVDDADLAKIDRHKAAKEFGDHTNDTRRHCYQVYYLQSLPLAKVVKVHTKVLAPPKRASVDQMLYNAMTLFAANGVELVGVSQEDLTDPGDLDRFRTLYVGTAAAPTAEVTDLHATFRSPEYESGPGLEASEVLIAVVRDMVPAASGCASHPEAQPGVLLSASLASEWTLAHELGHVLGLGDSADSDNLMYASTAAITADPPQLSEDDVATVSASPLAEG
ncbi:matrixin family metalloprotease [Nocardia implantans]|uniref:Matrixin family metalloprotease n=1 Tax=Nocardia implantans TaxID=3108168 RepID=A0ABU6AX88_9NOCA|nr:MULTISPECIES: matrixin family metalloprotease [unclassified Nocardia]MBF6193949.1 matrixin family metalloprotease [Nocardia beijingensis]MEA3529312.1 matrixin family metalloprotease [Nocardia sp. CDC192]MEB3511898.1 matrixin family metalloprotease [Nocardia sp. CDC186]